MSRSEASKVLLVVPCYNEADRFIAKAFSKALSEQPQLSLLFVNDGSQDETGAVLKGFIKEHPERAALCDLTHNGGKAEAVRAGFLHAFSDTSLGFDFIGYWDADLATPLEEVPRFLEVYSQKPELWLVMGARVNLLGRSIRRQAKRHYLGRVFATMASIVLNLPVYDTQCGAKIFRKQAELATIFKAPFISGWIFDVELLARMGTLLKAKRQSSAERIYELPLLAWEDVKGSKIKGRDFFRAALSLLRIARLYPKANFSQKSL